jgi:DNA-binding MurR/RpiR family transcriptional regulator
MLPASTDTFRTYEPIGVSHFSSVSSVAVTETRRYGNSEFHQPWVRLILILTPARAAHTREQSPAVQDRIRSLLAEMPSAVARVAEYLLNHPQAPLTLSIGELAEQAGASPATVTRFCRTIGYPGYVELRVGIATDVGRGSLDSWSTEIGGEFGPDDSPEDLLRMLISSHTKALREATSAIDLAVITEVSRRIALSSHVDIYGVVGSAMLAEELQGRLYRVGVPAYAWSEVHSGLTSAAIQDSDTVAIGISATGRTEETIEMLAEAGRAGAFTVAITNDPTSALAELADRSIVTSIYERFVQPDDLSAKHGQLLVLDLLYLLVAQENFDRSSAKLAASAHAVSTHRRPRRTPTRSTATGSGGSTDGSDAAVSEEVR